MSIARPDKSSLVKARLLKYPDHSSRAIARGLFNEHPGLFKSVHQARLMVAYYRGNRGGKMREELSDKRFLSNSGAKKINPFNIPKSDKKPYLPHKLTGSKIGIMADIHFPYHDEAALEACLSWFKKDGVDSILINGDLLDFYELSRFMKDKRMRDTVSELRMVGEFLASLNKSFPGVTITFKQGNHDERISHYVMNEAPALTGLGEVLLENILKLDSLDIDHVKDKRVVYAGKLAIVHGHEFVQGLIQTVSPARTYYMRAKRSVLGAHRHQVSEHNETDISGKLITSFSIGCLCDLNPPWMPINSWGHGCAIVDVEQKTGEFQVRNRRILNGKLV